MISLSPVRKSDVVIGMPLPWPIYDGNRKLLLRAGFVVESYSQVQRLIDGGLFREIDGEAGDLIAGTPEDASDDPSQLGGGSYIAKAPPRVPFNDIRLPVGTAMQLTNPANEAGGRETVRLIGYLDRKSLIVTHPARHGQIMFVKEGAVYRCRAFAGKNAYAFEAHVLRVALAPFPYLHLSFPATVQTNVIRKSARIPTEIVATAEPVGTGKVTTCTIKDLSVEGALIQSKIAIAEIGSEIRLAFRLTIDEEPFLFEIAAEIRSLQAASETEPNVMKCGVLFRKLDIAVRRELEIYIYRQMVSDL
ncbi:MAG: flagellar brake protein [Usitatibacteraceae bacterium]